MNRRWIVPVTALTLAVLTTFAVLSYVRGIQRQAAVKPQPIETEQVVFAKTLIGARHVVGMDALELRSIPTAAVHPQAARELAAVAGRVAMAPVYPDEQVLTTKFAPAGVNPGLTYSLAKDKRAMTIAVNEVIGVAGFLFPGDRVDVLGTVTLDSEAFSKVVLQDVEVLAIAQKVEQKPGEEPRVTTSATLAVTPEQAEILALVDSSGKVRLALRPYNEHAQVQTPGRDVKAALGRFARSVPKTVQPASTSTPRRSTAARTRNTPRPAAPAAAPRPPINNVDIWRGTTKTTVNF
ncbi:MAG: Flp pilus assembly protein CpaB [bacterium]